ncbi:four-helix bundle copper-binding protein [Streptomyces sp.]|uniref:four-helix bundle copper-binding protein n=1 Tax=Streptomyces sp. TaxID=1931 RepID=UPI002D7691B9|nr:four-helix bundle copper-binding protein [Streptomyces sp.]HET6355427.1 four-helix bundle copper-binding protein [Streptomyces sp.]
MVSRAAALGAAPRNGMVGELTKCIRTDMDCADICNTTASVLSRRTGYDGNITRAMLKACATACKACADECGSHADMEHCHLCALSALPAGLQACSDLLTSLG